MKESGELVSPGEGRNTLAVETELGRVLVTFDTQGLIADLENTARENGQTISPEILKNLQILQRPQEFLREFYLSNPEEEGLAWKITSTSAAAVHPINLGILSLSTGVISLNLKRPIVYLNSERFVNKMAGKQAASSNREDLISAGVEAELEREWLHQKEHLLRLIDLKKRMIDWSYFGGTRLAMFMVNKFFAKAGITYMLSSLSDTHPSWYTTVVISLGVSQLMSSTAKVFHPGERAAKKAEKGEAPDHLFTVNIEK